MDESREKKQVHWAVKAFVIFHAVMIIGWSLPGLSPEREVENRALPPLKRVQYFSDTFLTENRNLFRNRDVFLSYYMMPTGLWQSWDMFAPNPARTDMYMDAIVKYEDGSEKTVEYPRIYSMPIPKKFFHERYRKFRERLSPDAYEYKWPQTAYWMAAQAWVTPENPPVEIRLRRHWMDCPDIGTPVKDEYQTWEIYYTVLDQEKLKEFKSE
ncbi:MAG: hypothetical protein KDC26_03310 [Armatimonadetes bacterium]|nr:hypothetical protein [Armatimonadota bacterium]